MPLPSCILFDLDDTLISAYGPSREAWRGVAGEFAGALAPVTAEDAADAVFRFAETFWADAERHRIWRLQLSEARRMIVRGALAGLAPAGTPPCAPALADRMADRFSAYRDAQMHLFPDAHHVVDTMRARGIRLGLVTNGASAVQRAKIRRFDLAERFHHIQVEEEAGFGKPDERAYRHALAQLGVTAAETWMVGDNLEWEVAAPQRLGIRAIWHDGHGVGLPAGSAIRPDHSITRLIELLPLLEAE